MFSFFKNFLKQEAASGVILMMAAILALIFNNSALAVFYQQFFSLELFYHPLSFWINEGLMGLFFLLVGLELKREFIMGELSQGSHILLPLFAALGGMIVPALIYSAFNYHLPTIKGWPIPLATDIAFAVGVLSLFGKRIPLGLKLFLLALAIFDDLGAIIIIALFYVTKINWFLLGLAFLLLLFLYGLNRKKVYLLSPYLIGGILLWSLLLQSGVHATLAGVLLAMVIPIDQKGHGSPLHRLEENIHPWVAYGVMPLFALANAGVMLQQVNLATLYDSLTLGIILGLVLGKQMGVFSFSWVLIRLRIAKLPTDATWRDLYGVACLCGIGFTMSLFLGTLAFQYDHPVYLNEVRLAVLLASLLSGMIGAAVLLIRRR